MVDKEQLRMLGWSEELIEQVVTQANEIKLPVFPTAVTTEISQLTLSRSTVVMMPGFLHNATSRYFSLD